MLEVVFVTVSAARSSGMVQACTRRARLCHQGGAASHCVVHLVHLILTQLPTSGMLHFQERTCQTLGPSWTMDSCYFQASHSSALSPAVFLLLNSWYCVTQWPALYWLSYFESLQYIVIFVQLKWTLNHNISWTYEVGVVFCFRWTGIGAQYYSERQIKRRWLRWFTASVFTQP